MSHKKRRTGSMTKPFRLLLPIVIPLATLVALKSPPAGAAEVAAEEERLLTDPQKQAAARKLFQEIRCVVCAGETIGESNAAIAVSMRRYIRTHLQEGQSSEAIKAYLVSRYGEALLMTPPLSPRTFLLWGLPWGLLIGGFVFLWRFFRKTGRSREAENAKDAP